MEEPPELKAFRQAGFRFTVLFVTLFIVSVPFPFHILPDVGGITRPFFEWLARLAAVHLFGIDRPFTAAIVSDSTGMYVHLFDLAMISAMITLLWCLLDRSSHEDRALRYWFHTAIAYYLATQLLRYGLEKVFKHQFYLPEPNTLYTPLGQLSPDILYWSTVGSSWSYSFFAGLLEVIPALLLLFRRTRLVGALIAVAAMIHVVILNFGFDISVKIFSCFLLLLALIIASPHARSLYRFLIRHEPARLEQPEPVLDSQRKVLLYAVIKGLAIGVILFESLFLYFQSGSFNDDTAARPFLHGAYDVLTFVRNGDTLPALPGETARPRRIFIHRRGYLITQSMTDRMIDYRLDYDTLARMLRLTDPSGGMTSALHYRWSEPDSLLRLDGTIGRDTISMVARRLDLSTLPLMEGGFHWTIDDYR